MSLFFLHWSRDKLDKSVDVPSSHAFTLLNSCRVLFHSKMIFLDLSIVFDSKAHALSTKLLGLDVIKFFPIQKTDATRCDCSFFRCNFACSFWNSVFGRGFLPCFQTFSHAATNL